MTLSEPELERYSRQLLMDDWSGAAQERLRSARALVVGAGALGSPVCTYLVAAGVGTLGVVDGDVVELSNLHRQPLYMTPDVGSPKAEVAAAKLGLLNPDVMVEPFPAELGSANAEAIVMGADVVVDCTDSFASRYLVNDACCAQQIPLVEAGVVGFEGLVLSIRPGESACYRCAFPSAPEGDAKVMPGGRRAGRYGRSDWLDPGTRGAQVDERCGAAVARPNPADRRPRHEPDAGGDQPEAGLPCLCGRIGRCWDWPHLRGSRVRSERI